MANFYGWKIYKITNNLSRKSYIGITSKTINERLDAHIEASETGRFNKNGTMYALYAAFNKYGIDSFSVELLEEDMCLEEAQEKETYYIQEYNTYGGGKSLPNLPRGYNESYGGEIPDFDDPE